MRHAISTTTLADRLDPPAHPHRRFNPISREWVLVSPHRAERPWLGEVEAAPKARPPRYEPGCHLCPGNVRAGGRRNPSYEGPFIFENDFPALLCDTPGHAPEAHPLLRTESARGVCKVVCYSQRHDLTFGELDDESVIRIVDVWTEQYEELGQDPVINHVEVFENRGAMMGASNPHPHGQIWATEFIPDRVVREQDSLADYCATHGRSLLADYLSLELERDERIVCSNEHFIALVPYWAVWPYETLVVSRRQIASLASLTVSERASLADISQRLVTRYDNLFDVTFPYSMGMHQAPTDGWLHPEWHFHVHFYPPLLRSATVRKFMVGFELLAEAQRDMTPERAAKTLRSMPERHTPSEGSQR